MESETSVITGSGGHVSSERVCEKGNSKDERGATMGVTVLQCTESFIARIGQGTSHLFGDIPVLC
jgi:hypothetical protein